jgi:glycosyltransferase involved in cell wall biosynthesis
MGRSGVSMSTTDTRVALLTSSVSRSAGGVFDAVRHLAASLQHEAEQPVRVLGLRDCYTDADRDAWGDVPVSAFDVTGPGALGFAPGLRRALEEAGPEIVHVHGLWMYPSVASLRWARHEKPYVISPHGMLDPWAVRNSAWKKRLAGALYENKHLRGAACLHALNQQEAEAFRRYGLTNPVCVIPNGVEIPTERTTVDAAWKGEIPEDARVLFYIGRLHPKKGLDTLLRGWSIAERDAKASGWHLAIAGWDQNGHEQELRELAGALGLNGHVHFVGPQFGEQKSAAYQAADAFVLPSLSEGLPMTVLEAWANGLAVAMTPECNLPHGFEAGAALRIEPETESIAEGLRSLFAMSDAERKLIGERGLALVKERYQWSQVAAQMSAVYEWALGSGSLPDFVLS